MSAPAQGLQILELVRDAYRLLLNNIKSWALAMAVPLVIELAVTYGFFKLHGLDFTKLMMGLEQNMDGLMLLRFLAMQVALMISYVIFAVTWHRYALLGREAPPTLVPSVQRRHMRFLLISIGISVILGLLFGLFVTVIGLLRIQSSLVIILALVALGAIFVRWQMIFPAIAIDRSLSLANSWRLTRGQGIRLFWALLLSALPFVLSGFVINELFVVGTTVFIMTGALSFEAALGFVLSGINGFAVLAMVVAVASEAYRRLGPGE